MLAIIKSSRHLRRFLLAALVFSLTSSAGATEAHEGGGDMKGHGDPVIASAALSGGSARPLADQDSDHETHCSVDALCITGAWTLTGQSAVALPPRISTARVRPRKASVTGLRPRPELRPPRDNR